MPSYRRDRPERTPGPRPSPGYRRDIPPRPREEEEIEERGFRTPPMFRREMGPSEYASRPIGPQERRSLEDILVPKSEREDPYFDYSKVFDMFPRFGRGRAPAAGPGPGPIPPPREAPPRGESPRREVEMRVAEAMGTLSVDRIWSAARTLKADPRYRPGSPVAVVRIAKQTDVPQIFRLNASDVGLFFAWWGDEVNAIRPPDLRGSFVFQNGRDGFVWLAYVE